MKIVVDFGGCDNALAFAKGIAPTLNQTDASIVAVGNEQVIRQALCGQTYDESRLEILHAVQEITNQDSPVEALRQKKQSSLVLALNKVKSDDDCVAFISAGSTGAVLCGATIVLGRVKGVERPTLATILPNKLGAFTCLADCGANVDCRPEHLAQFARLGSLYMKSVYGIDNPTVYNLSVGSEDKKGNGVTKEAFQLLKQSNLNFCGNIEANAVLDGFADVIACDGFDGNILLKCIEGTAKLVAQQLGGYLKKNAPPQTDLSFVKKSIGDLFAFFDFTSGGGAVLLGVKNIVVKAHGSANEQTLVSCAKQAITMYKGGYLDKLNDIQQGETL